MLVGESGGLAGDFNVFSKSSFQTSSFDVSCPLSGDVANSREVFKGESFWCITTDSVQDSVLSFLASSSDCFWAFATIISCGCLSTRPCFIMSNLRGKVGVNSDSSVLLSDVRCDTVPDMVSNPSSRALSLLLA